jgi:hypothetical protein
MLQMRNRLVLRLLAAIFSERLPAKEKKKILTKEYDILMTRDMEEEVEAMCNLGYGVLERGIEQGIKRGIERGIEQGIERGIEQANRLKDDLFIAMKRDNRLDDYAESVQNKDYYEILLKEYGLLSDEQ